MAAEPVTAGGLFYDGQVVGSPAVVEAGSVTQVGVTYGARPVRVTLSRDAALMGRGGPGGPGQRVYLHGHGGGRRQQRRDVDSERRHAAGRGHPGHLDGPRRGWPLR
ncbi:hypothetical protein ACFP9V_21495 [Deinococcus radiopugnans]|uniref:hypothetical protein n=1 Tax=Deinococcus radiopugnans TaxID=57497 RepID=UPI00361D9361